MSNIEGREGGEEVEERIDGTSFDKELELLKKSRPDCLFSTSCSTFFSTNETGHRRCERLKRIFRTCPEDERPKEVLRESTEENMDDSNDDAFPSPPSFRFPGMDARGRDDAREMSPPMGRLFRDPAGDRRRNPFEEVEELMRDTFGQMFRQMDRTRPDFSGPPAGARSRDDPSPFRSERGGIPYHPPHMVPRGRYGKEDREGERQPKWTPKSKPEVV